MIKNLKDFKVYNLSIAVAEEVWILVSKWNYFEKDTIGKQLVKAVDSIAANLSEGLGRYHFKEAKNFSYYSRGSLFETRTWLTKSLNRQLLPEENYKKLMDELEVIGKMLNSYIKSIGTVNEPIEEYQDPDA